MSFPYTTPARNFNDSIRRTTLPAKYRHPETADEFDGACRDRAVRLIAVRYQLAPHLARLITSLAGIGR
jgi:hypothetical protein